MMIGMCYGRGELADVSERSVLHMDTVEYRGDTSPMEGCQYQFKAIAVI